MIKLPNNCSCSKLSVHPKNWKNKTADMKCTWYISYRFYDPAHTKPKQVIIKGFNKYKELELRQQAVQVLLSHELNQLLHGLNKFKEAYTGDESNYAEITEYTGVADALDWAYNQLALPEETLASIKSSLNKMKKSIFSLGFQGMPLNEFKTKHARRVLEKCRKENDLSPQSFNHYRAYLLMLFKKLLHNDAIDYNPVIEIDKMPVLKKIKRLLTPAERKKVNDYFLEKDIYFYRFMQCFFHSGAREVELLELKKADVNLQTLTYKVIVKKGALYEEQLRPIKEIAVPFWEAQLNECRYYDDFIFGACLRPGRKKGRRGYITLRWKREVKCKLNIPSDFYALKHLNLDETAALLSAEDASKMAGHTSTVITMKHYLVNEKERQNERLRKVKNSFC